MSIAGAAQRHGTAICVGVLLLVLAGIYALLTLPAGIFPEVTYPRIVVLARAGTFEAHEMTVAVTRPLEQALGGVVDLRRIRTRTFRGAAELSLDFRPDADMQFALSQVQGRLASTGADLPPEVQLTAERLTPSVFPILQYELTGVDPLVLRDLADLVVAPRLTGVPDVGLVEVQGGLVREIAVQLDPGRLLANHLSVDLVADAIRSANQAVAAGRVNRSYRQYGIVVSGLTNTPTEVGGIVVRRAGDRFVRVADLGTVGYGAQDRWQIVSGNGRPAALINIARQPDGSTLALQRAVRASLDSVRPLLPAGVRLESVYDQAELVRASMAGVRDAMLVGGALAVAVLLLFLRRWRTTVAAALTLPVTVAITLLGLDLGHESLNLMSLGGLAVAIGLVIDDAVVVVENIERRLGQHPAEAPAEVVRAATDEILGPVASSTLTTVVVFAPLGLLQGVVGAFFRAFAFSLAMAVLVSLALATTLIPVLLSRWLVATGPEGARHHRLDWLDRRYVTAATWLLAHRRTALAAAAVLLATAALLLRVLGTGFLPQMDEGGFILDYRTPPGSSLAETDRQMRVLEGILRSDPDIQAFTRRTGAELGFAATAQNSGDFTVLLTPRSRRSVSVYTVIDRVRRAGEERAPAVRMEFMQLLQDVMGDLAGAPAPVELKLFGADLGTAETAARRVVKAVAGVPGLVDLYDGIAGDDPEVRVDLDPVRVTRLGLSLVDVEAQARGALFGTEAGSAREPDRLVPIRVRVPDSVRYRPDVVSALPILGPGGWVPLGRLGTVRDTADAAELLRENRRPMVAVTGQVEGRSLGAVMRDIRAAVGTVAMPPGVALEYGGQHASQQQSFRELLAVLTLAVGAVLLVLVAQFNALRGPLAIVLAIPVGLTGALVALAVTGVPLNVSSFMGLILLVGLIVKNGILLFDAAEALRRKGEAPRDALVGAGRLRLRPILMTTLCTLAGLVPLALGLGAGAELQQPLAIAVIGGLIVSTGVTLLLLPVGLEAVRALHVRGPAKAAGWSGLALVAVLAGFPASRLEAQATDSVPTAPRSPHVIRWYEAAAAVGGVALLSVVDEPIQDWIQDHRSEGTDDAAGIFRREGEPIWWGGITVGVTAAGLIIGDDDVTRTGARAITSVAASAVASTGIKYLLSRSRPAEGVGAFEFHPFSSLKDSDGTELRFSMPSGHTTAAFAVATTLADEIRSPVADVLLYTFATGTAWSRMNDDRHWLTDTAFGAILGITTAKVVNGRWRIFNLRPPAVLVGKEGTVALSWQASF